MSELAQPLFLESERDLIRRIEEALDQVRPAIEADGGDVDLVEVRDSVAYVRMSGACKGCPMSQMTLQMGIEYAVRQACPEILQVLAAPDDDEIVFYNLKEGR